ncbi:MAG TPA: hypothetical protein PLM07_13460 [Candidatus Rifleibacterium sp.]|nr:hypothetical protein [Candidatus Rifleibacterium sp.]HPT46892.1 hypothetical protein [Candidatus Rifleibacterium sp.]
MILRNQLQALILLLAVIFILPAGTAEAGFFSDVKLWYNEKSNINQHSRVIGNEVKTLYRERKSIQSFAEGTSSLIQAYRAIKDKNSKTSLPQILDIATAISKVVKEYNNLAPKAEAMYKKSQPSMKYFSQLTDKTETIQTTRNKIIVKSFSDGRLNKLAGANGWSRVWDSVKSNPLNAFRWGKLSDEYKLGKVEAQYPLKCAQIAFEASAYYFAARDSIQELLGIQKEIEGIVGGDLASILNISSTISKIQNSGNSIEAIGELAKTGTDRISKRFEELVKVQNDYVAINKAYNEKYNRADGSNASTSNTGTTGNSTTLRSGSAPAATTQASGATPSLDRAMENYQKAYQAYVELSQQGSGADQAKLNQAINNLNKAKQQVENARGR